VNDEIAVEEEAVETSSGRRRWPWYARLGVGVAAVIVLVVIVAIARPRAQSDYDDAVRDRFIGACTEQGGDGVRDTCSCFYEQIQQNVPFDRFELLDESLATQLQLQEQTDTQGEALALPEDISGMLDRCVEETGGP
jgi:hypothetical protein